jgi:hypothetical protein
MRGRKAYFPIVSYLKDHKANCSGIAMAGPAMAGLFSKPALYSPPQHSIMHNKLSEKDREALHEVKGLLENTGVHFTIPQLEGERFFIYRTGGHFSLLLIQKTVHNIEII